MEYVKALEQAALLADRTGQSVFIIGQGDDYAVLSYEPKLLGGRSIQEVPPRRRSPSIRVIRAIVVIGLAASFLFLGLRQT
jgi:hypothetical protein